MSQAKVDKHKQEKYNRKKNVKKRNFKKIAAYVVATLIAIAFIGYIGYWHRTLYSCHNNTGKHPFKRSYWKFKTAVN